MPCVFGYGGAGQTDADGVDWESGFVVEMLRCVDSLGHGGVVQNYEQVVEAIFKVYF